MAKRKLISRPADVVAVERNRHDRARRRGLAPRFAHAPGWIAGVATGFALACMVFVARYALDLRPGWLSAQVFDDEATRALREGALRLGYLAILLIVLGFTVPAQMSAQLAAQYLPLGLAAGVALPVLVLVHLDRQAGA